MHKRKNRIIIYLLCGSLTGFLIALMVWNWAIFSQFSGEVAVMHTMIAGVFGTVVAAVPYAILGEFGYWLYMRRRPRRIVREYYY
ncbi:MAG: hypothetical protein FWE73_06210 [Candidatus Bathyarchaeota archaeon]|nr:hypothetical protein [Candidatus Termitimicrobium sp.]